MSVQIRPITAAQIETFQQTMSVPFGSDPTPELAERFANVFELERLRAAFDGDQMVATFGAFSFRLAVPGSMLPTAGTTVVTVLPTHRRQGILRAMMTEHLAEVHANKEPLAALWASESSIYGRFGYGPASDRAVIRVEKSYAHMQQPISIRGTVRLVDRDEALGVFPGIYEKAARVRPGMFLRDKGWWEHRLLSDPQNMRQGATALRRVLHVRAGGPAGYVLYRTHTDHTQATTEVKLVELVGVDFESEKTLWQYIFGIDLVTSIVHWNQPVDHPLRWWLQQPGRMERKIEDALWVRPVDVAAALSGRRYARDGCVVFRMHDQQCPWNDGVYRLDVDGDGTGHCQRAEADAEIDLTAYALGAVYLGGHRFRDLARSGIVTGTVPALQRADSMFSWDPLPWCPEVF